MDEIALLIVILGCIGILAGYLRLIVDEEGNIPINIYRLTGCFGLFMNGMTEGTIDLLRGHISDKSRSALMVYLGLACLLLGFIVI